MADLKEGTEGNETVAQSDDSQEFREREEDGSVGEEDGQDLPEETTREQAHSRKPRSKVPLLLGALGLGMAAGFAMGYVDRGSQVKLTKKEAGAAVQGKDNQGAGPCKAWADTICERMGELAYECTEARVAASALLSDSACAQAQDGVLAKIEALKAERVSCNELTGKLCTDLGPEGKGCEFVKAKEPAFSLGECQNMTKDYKQVLARVMERQEKGTIPRSPSAHKPRSLSISAPN